MDKFNDFNDDDECCYGSKYISNDNQHANESMKTKIILRMKMKKFVV